MNNKVNVKNNLTTSIKIYFIFCLPNNAVLFLMSQWLILFVSTDSFTNIPQVLLHAVLRFVIQASIKLKMALKNQMGHI